MYEKISVAINYLFPTMRHTSTEYLEIANFIRHEYQRLGTAVLYFKNMEFMKLLNHSDLSIGNKEVIVTDKVVRATPHYHNYPYIIFEV